MRWCWPKAGCYKTIGFMLEVVASDVVPFTQARANLSELADIVLPGIPNLRHQWFRSYSRLAPIP